MHAARFQCKSLLLILVWRPNGIELKIYNTLIVDKNFRGPAAAQASSNIVRCTLAAIAVSFLQNMIETASVGWTFTFMAVLCSLAAALFALDYHRGTAWRQKHTVEERRER